MAIAKVKRCTRCLLVTTRPDTDFVDGVCSACLNYDAQTAIDWDQRKQDLVKLFERQKPNGSGFDCIVASSGGKDSHAQALDLIGMGIRPLLVTATTCMLTDIGRRNIDNLKRYTPTIEVTPNQEVRALLNFYGLTMVGDISWPEHVAIFTTPMRMAVALGIPLVFYGENPQAAYGGPMGSEKSCEMTRRWVSEFGGFLGLRPVDLIGQGGITANDMKEYEFPTTQQIKRSHCEAHFLGQYLGPWNSHANARKAAAAGMEVRLPFEGNLWEHENLDNAMTGIHDYMMYRKYGLSRACQQISMDIRYGMIDRDKAQKILAVKEGTFPEVYAGVPAEKVCERLNISREFLDKTIAKFTNKRIFPDEPGA